jgi:hypothetical protein
VLGTGVNPSPVPDPQSFQKPMSGVRAIGHRAAPICANAQNRANGPAKRKNDRLTVCGNGFSPERCVNLSLHIAVALESHRFRWISLIREQN